MKNNSNIITAFVTGFLEYLQSLLTELGWMVVMLHFKNSELDLSSVIANTYWEFDKVVFSIFFYYLLVWSTTILSYA